MAQCITCGSELHPDRAKKYDYCMVPECQEKNLKSLTMVAIGVNKSAEQYLVLDDKTRDGLASGRLQKPRQAVSRQSGAVEGRSALTIAPPHRSAIALEHLSGPVGGSRTDPAVVGVWVDVAAAHDGDDVPAG